ncbi:hypothetical protein K435DRAFT_256496 [Dendrothele bispora CBS 962.96]|uniref:MARVEL domain-containing protein n=1 Tax=Dendrothele bispora (strain CBS 962.96) TaxID=1314807 RepID=A0A4S8LMT5_DENBC|nr:hypothetical protein K435DRAFT_256496 [Dendrothele bispora CBS 962.96]
MANISGFRTALYFLLSLFSIVVLGLSATRLHYTLHVPLGDPVNGGEDFYDRIVVELLVASILTMLWSWFVMWIIRKRKETAFVSTFRGGFIGLAILWLMWLIGVIVVTHMWGDLRWCQIYKPCRILTALVAFVWIGWITMTVIFIVEIIFVSQNGGSRVALHGRWDPRVSTATSNRPNYGFSW